MLKTERLILRRFEESDAENVFEYAKDPAIGPIAGWPPHKSASESLDVIRNVFSAAECYAVCLKEDGKAIGAIELKLNGHTDMTDRDDECELGYWLGRPFWGRGIIPEAVREMLRHAFEDLGMQNVWCGYYDGNTKSKRVQEKCGFRYQWTTKDVDVPLMHEKRTGHVNLMTKDRWLWSRLYESAKSVQNERKISEYVEAGGVAAAILSASGRIYTGVCVDTCSSLGICAERNAIFNMLTNGEQEIRKVLTYRDIEIMLDHESEQVITLGELTPNWWIGGR